MMYVAVRCGMHVVTAVTVRVQPVEQYLDHPFAGETRSHVADYLAMEGRASGIRHESLKSPRSNVHYCD